MGNVQTLDTYDGLIAAERYIRKNNLNISTSFSNKSFEKPSELETLSLSLYAKVTYKLFNNMPLHKNEESFLIGQNDFVRRGILKLGGWIFNLNSMLKTYWVKDNDGSIFEYKAVSKKSLKVYLKEYMCVPISKIKIVEIGA